MMNAQSLTSLVAAVSPKARIVAAPSLDPEQVARKILFNIWARTECSADLIETTLRSVATVRRCGPVDIEVNLDTTYKATADGNYSSVWDD